MNSRLVLASASPRRCDLMREAGYEFEVVPAADVDEVEDPALGINLIVSINARLKSEAVAEDHPDAIVIGADTMVALNGAPLGKPEDMSHAEEMLEKLVGHTHEVCTGVCLSHPELQVEFMVRSMVTFKPLSMPQIREYLSLINPLDKAGGYAAQEHGEHIIERIEGSVTNVIGLPMERLQEELTRFEEVLSGQRMM